MKVTKTKPAAERDVRALWQETPEELGISPTPWKCNIEERFYSAEIVDASDITVCELFFGLSKTCRANANLIVAAPKLLKACKLLLGVFEQIGEVFGENIGPNSTIAYAREAIAKAGGQE